MPVRPLLPSLPSIFAALLSCSPVSSPPTQPGPVLRTATTGGPVATDTDEENAAHAGEGSDSGYASPIDLQDAGAPGEASTPRQPTLLDGVCTPFSAYGTRAINPADRTECVFDASADLLLSKDRGELYASPDYLGRLFRLVDQQVTSSNYDSEPCSPLHDCGDRCPLDHVARPFIVSGALDSEQSRGAALLRVDTNNGYVTCRTKYRETRRGCEHAPCPRWFNEKRTMIVRATRRGLLLIAPPKGFR